MRQLLVTAVAILAFGVVRSTASGEDLIYGYECRNSKCIQVELDEANFEKAISLPVCRMFCDSFGTVWPKPTAFNVGHYMQQIDVDNIQFNLPSLSNLQPLWTVSKDRFMKTILASVPDRNILKSGGHSLTVSVAFMQTTADELPKLTLDTDESYTLTIDRYGDSGLEAQIEAKSFFGARHGLETLSQLIVYDDIRHELQMVNNADITDEPSYHWRGLLLDTARNFFSVDAIKRTLDGMAMVKLNRFHWHITDSHSFPFQVKSQPELYKLGAYSPRKVYTHEQIADIVEYGRARGVSVIPEFDAPAHVGEGWQHKDMTACFRAQPWSSYCVEPPCGQLDPTVDALYPVLEDIYREMFALFEPDIFHMGGDEVSVECWNSSQRIQQWMLSKGWKLTKPYFIRLWGEFQKKALDRVDHVASPRKPLITLWTSHLTDAPYIDDYLDKDRYIIQIWTKGNDKVVTDILKRGYRTIFSNYDALYLDCGGPGWVASGNNWCSPYIGWQKVYDNKLDNLAGKYSSQVLGAEAAIWSEQIDEFTLDSRFWPRASALAERLWSNPSNHWREAESRMLYHRERLVDNGLAAEAMQPQWCLRNEGECPQ